MTTPSPLDEAEEKDSLFSDKSEDKAVKIQTPEAETSEHVKVSYSDEDLDKLVGFVKNLTTLYDLRPDDWKEENYEVIKRFFLTPTEPILTIYFINDDLTCSLGPPTRSVMDLTYFLRQPFEVFEVATFFDNINFGTMDDNIEGSILNIVENVYAPVFLKSNHWLISGTQSPKTIFPDEKVNLVISKQCCHIKNSVTITGPPTKNCLEK